MSNNEILKDIEILSEVFQHVALKWDGKSCISEMQKATNPHWRQMEWIGFYAEFVVRNALTQRPDSKMCTKGEVFGNVSFDLKGAINWDIKAHPNTTKGAILNDCEAMDLSLTKYGRHGVLMICADCHYDEDGEFKSWHDQLKGGTSRYEQERRQRGTKSRRRKVSAILTAVHFIVLDPVNLLELNKKQKNWRNSDGNPRREKYSISNQQIEKLACTKIVF
jgi:hypothetical protein